MKKLINLLLVGTVLVSFSACSWGNDDATNVEQQNNEGPSAVGPDSLPEMRGPLKPPTS